MQVKFCVDPVSPTSISHDTAEARSQQLSQPGAMGGGGFAGPPEESLLAEKHDFISGPPEFQVLLTRFLIPRYWNFQD